jgi:ribonuclease PH
MNVVLTGAGRFIELQATGEQTTFDAALLDRMLALGRAGVTQLLECQRAVLPA